MQLSQEDSLRLNVLLNQALHAVRIDEGKMIVYGLTEKGDAKIQLNPNCKDGPYIRRVKELISSHVLGSPGGYPVFLKRWARMGQARAESLESLLKLGEPEAVVAVVGAEGLTNEIARRAWWAMPGSDSARRMLANQEVVKGDMGKILADFLLEFLPFEEEPRNIIESVRLVLQPGLIDDKSRLELWKKGQRKNVFLVGFLSSTPDDLPQEILAHYEHDNWKQLLEELAKNNNVPAKFLLRITSQNGQACLKTIESVLKNPANQDVIVFLFKAIEDYFKDVRPHNEPRREITRILEEASHCCAMKGSCRFKEDIDILIERIPDSKPLLESMLVFSYIGEQLVNPIFALTNAVGSVMRSKIEPITKPLGQHLDRLLGKTS